MSHNLFIIAYGRKFIILSSFFVSFEKEILTSDLMSQVTDTPVQGCMTACTGFGDNINHPDTPSSGVVM